MMNAPSRSPEGKPGLLDETGLALQLSIVASLPLVNALWFDWDAGMVAGLLIAETLTVLLMLPLLWMSLEHAWHRLRQQQARDWLTRHAAEPVPADQELIKRHQRALQPFPYLKSAASTLFAAALVIACGGLLPVIMLSGMAPQWPDFVVGMAASEWGMSEPLAFLIWPFLLAWSLSSTWPSYTWSVLAVITVTAFQVLAMVWQSRRRHVHPRDLEDEATLLLGLVTVPLFIMAGLAWALGTWFAELRSLPPAMAGQDAAMWSMVALIVLRALSAAASRVAQRSQRAWHSGDQARQHGAGRAPLVAACSALLGVLAVLLLALAISSPRSIESASVARDCLSNWPGQFREGSRALTQAASGQDLTDPASACERLGTATSLRLNEAIDASDLDWFSAVQQIELHAGAVRHLGELHRLPALRRVLIANVDLLDASSLSLPAHVDTLIITRSSIAQAQYLWHLDTLKQLALSEVMLLELPQLRGRTTLGLLGLQRVSGDLDGFMQGALGLESLRLRDTPFTDSMRQRLLWLRKLDVGDDMGDSEYCAMIRGLHRVQDARAQRCSTRITAN